MLAHATRNVANCGRIFTAQVDISRMFKKCEVSDFIY